VKVIIVGAGEVGFHIAHRLASERKEVVVIDRNPEVLKRFSEWLDVQWLEGSGANPKMPEEAEIRVPEFWRK